MSGGSRTARAIIIGNELLTGKIADKNLTTLATVLRRLGVVLERAVVIPDVAEVIVREVREASVASTWVFTSGGVGPTHDDLTIAAVASAFDEEVIVSSELESLIRLAYGDKLREGHLLMARVPRGARLVKSEDIPWPATLMRNVWVLPGVPEIFELKMKLVEEVVGAGVPFVSLAVLTTLDEGNIKPMLDRVVLDHPDVDVGSYPRWTDPKIRTKLTFDGRDRARCEAARQAFVALLPDGAMAGLEG
ncbi:MAG: competence/damage-inducible protein A [Myxococcales bacterium]|nr:competence/damage-inducible protein A [Myxococcales bacterium]